MSRNKYPEQTVERILAVAYRLFLEKGYEHTSIQDIVDGLGGLSKGAIYHHFKSKEDILVAVADRMTAESNQLLEGILARPGLTGKQKLKALFWESLARPVQDEMFAVAPDFGKNPRLLCSLLEDTVRCTAPRYVAPILRQGMADGSIQTDCPDELAELILLAANVWMDPMVFDSTPEQSRRKFLVLRQMLAGFGLDIVDDEMLARLQQLAAIYQSSK